MSNQSLFNAGSGGNFSSKNDTARQAVHSLRGYAYQAVSTALAWLEIDEKEKLFLEVAEDYAIVANSAINLVQVKDTGQSRSITLNSKDVKKAVATYVDLVHRNPSTQVSMRFLTTSEIGIERRVADRLRGCAGLHYWKRVAEGEDMSPLRSVLESKFSKPVQSFVEYRTDDEVLKRDLIQRIYWDCGKPDFETLQQEFEASLTVFSRDNFNLPSQDVPQLADALIYYVLQKSTKPAIDDRILSRSDLYKTVDSYTTVSLPRRDLSAILNHLSSSMSKFKREQTSLSSKNLKWLIDGTTLPPLQGLVSREKIESEVVGVFKKSNLSILYGSSGLGKSMITRSVAVAREGNFFIVDFRNAMAAEARDRLDIVFALIGSLTFSTIIFEDLNLLNDTGVTLSLARVSEALRRRFRKVLITCYNKPSTKFLASIGVESSCVVECPYFSKQETNILVKNYGGNPKAWGAIAHIAGCNGHPQLTHALVIGAARRNWSKEESEAIINQGFKSDDTKAALEATRRALVVALPEGTRTLLYRLSMVGSRFSRSLALALGESPPPLLNSGENLDELIGPWIENVGSDMYQVSPLVGDTGRANLSTSDQFRISKKIAGHMLESKTIHAVDFDNVLIHAINGKLDHGLTKLALYLIQADDKALKILAEQIIAFRLYRTDTPIYENDEVVSTMLRLAQFKLAVAAQDIEKIPEVTAALFSEIEEFERYEQKLLSEAMAFVTVLCTPGIANYLNNWITLLRNFVYKLDQNRHFRSFMDETKQLSNEDNVYIDRELFHAGSWRISTVEQLENIINDLDKIDSSIRNNWLTPIKSEDSDYGVLINGPWATERHKKGFNAKNALACYQRMEHKTKTWGIRPLTLQCIIGQAALLDEYLDNQEGALSVLSKATASFGEDILLSRAIAKVYWRSNEHQKVLDIFGEIAEKVGQDTPVERAFTLREAAISAAECGDWMLAKKWFLDAKLAANRAEGHNMHAMRIGLEVDEAVAEINLTNLREGISLLANALTELAHLDPEATICTAYCHRVVRHSILWAYAQTTGSHVPIDNEPIKMEAGSCSNPDPKPEIRELPLAEIDFAWYMLAETEVAAGGDFGILDSLHNRLVKGVIPTSEWALRHRIIEMNIINLNPEEFAKNFMQYIETRAYVKENMSRLMDSFDPLDIPREKITKLQERGPFNSVVESAAIETIMAYMVSSVLNNNSSQTLILNLEKSLANRFPEGFPGMIVFSSSMDSASALSELDYITVTVLKTVSKNSYIDPRAFCGSSLRLFEWINNSIFANLLIPKFSMWLRDGWKQKLSVEKFRLTNPRITVPPIEEIISSTENNRSFSAKLLLKTSMVVGISLGSEYQDNLKALADTSNGNTGGN